MLRSIPLSCRRWYGSVGRTNVSSLQRVKLENSDVLEGVVIVGWLRSVRRQKKLTFLSLNDGSCATPLQIIASSEDVPSELTLGSCIHAVGDLRASRGRGQSTELKSESLTVLGKNPTEIHPLGDGRLVENKTARKHPHLRPQLPGFGALLRLRHRLEQAIHNTYNAAGYFHVHTPLLTKSDCEGAGETLTIAGGETFFSHQASENADENSDVSNENVHLTVSSQLHLEAMTNGLGRVYTLSPAFRGEKSMTRHHLSEFYMLEGESIDLDSEDALCRHVEDILRRIGRAFLGSTEDVTVDLDLIDERLKEKSSSSPESSVERIERFIETPFVRMTFAEALETLLQNSSTFTESAVTKDMTDFGKEHERFLSNYVGSKPLFITGFPAVSKPFYCALSSDRLTAQAVDLLLPDVGEVMGGSIREVDYETLKERMMTSGGSHFVSNMQWYLDLRRRVLEEREKILDNINQYSTLKNTIAKFKDSGESLQNVDTKVDIGHNFYVNARIPDASKILVDVGFGFFIEMSHSEATEFISKKIEILEKKADILTKKSHNIKANIKVVLEGLRELQNIPMTTETQGYRDVLS